MACNQTWIPSVSIQIETVGKLPLSKSLFFVLLQFSKIPSLESDSLKEFSIQTRNLELSGIEWGEADCPAVLALHGWLDNAASFIPIASHLHGLRLIALDMPGHGKSQHRNGVNAYHFIDYAADIILAADALRLKRFSLLGHSLGAAVSGVIAAILPQRVDRLAMIEGLAPLTATADKFMDQLRSHVEKTTASAATPSVYSNLDDAARVRQKAGPMSLSSARLIVERNLVHSNGGFRWRTDRCLRQPSPIYLTEDQVIHYLRNIKSAAMLIRSSNGIIKSWERMQGREQYLENLTVIDIDGEHHCHMDQPGDVAQHVLPFLQSSNQLDLVECPRA